LADSFEQLSLLYFERPTGLFANGFSCIKKEM